MKSEPDVRHVPPSWILDTFNFLAGENYLERNSRKRSVKLNKKISMSAVRESVSKIARKVTEGLIHCAMPVQVAAMRCER